MKTKEELNALAAEVETLNKKLAALTEAELSQVLGGEDNSLSPKKKKRPPLSGPDTGTVPIHPSSPEEFDY